MSKIQTAAQLAAACKKVATEYKTLYVLGCFGAPMTAANKTRYTNNLAYNAKYARKKKINAASADTFGFDCVCMIKGLLWGWNGDTAKSYGGAKYATNDVPDIGADQMIKVCKGVSTDFSNIQIGEAVWMAGHIGVYIGDGLAVECTPKWKDGVQITAVHNIGKKSGYNGRTWTKHGKLPYVSYAATKTVAEIAQEVIDGKWYNGAARKSALTAAGYDYAAVQKAVNELLAGKTTASKTVDDLAREVIAGKWGTGSTRKRKLEAAGYDYAAVQKRVNELLKG